MSLIITILFGYYLIDSFQEHDLSNKCQVLGINKTKILKKRYIELIILNTLILFIDGRYKSYCVVLAYLLYKRHIYRVRYQFKKHQAEMLMQFSIWLRSLEVLLDYYTVPQAIEQSISNAPSLMRYQLQELTKSLDVDPMRKETYVNFMSEIEDTNIEKTMYHLYRYAVIGTNEATFQLTNMIKQNTGNLHKQRQNMFDQKLLFYSWFGLIPMLIVSIVFLGLMFLVLTQLLQGGWVT